MSNRYVKMCYSSRSHEDSENTLFLSSSFSSPLSSLLEITITRLRFFCEHHSLSLLSLSASSCWIESSIKSLRLPTLLESVLAQPSLSSTASSLLSLLLSHKSMTGEQTFPLKERKTKKKWNKRVCVCVCAHACVHTRLIKKKKLTVWNFDKQADISQGKRLNIPWVIKVVCTFTVQSIMHVSTLFTPKEEVATKVVTRSSYKICQLPIFYTLGITKPPECANLMFRHFFLATIVPFKL